MQIPENRSSQQKSSSLPKQRTLWRVPRFILPAKADHILDQCSAPMNFHSNTWWRKCQNGGRSYFCWQMWLLVILMQLLHTTLQTKSCSCQEPSQHQPPTTTPGWCHTIQSHPCLDRSAPSKLPPSQTLCTSHSPWWVWCHNPKCWNSLDVYGTQPTTLIIINTMRKKIR